MVPAPLRGVGNGTLGWCGLFVLGSSPFPGGCCNVALSQAKAREEEARDILARASKNQADDGPSTRKAAIRAYRYLHTMTTQHGALIQQGT